MSFLNRGTQETARIVFNSGYFNFGGKEIVNLNRISINIGFTHTYLRVLNSIKPTGLVRHTLDVSVDGEMTSVSPAILERLFGVSSGTNPTTFSILDGQPALLSPFLVCYDTNGKQYQYQLIDGMFTKLTVNNNTEAYSSYSFTFVASDIKVVLE